MSQTNDALSTVTSALTAASNGRFDELGAMLAADIEWLGLPEADGETPRCRGRSEALTRMRIGLLANDMVSVATLEQSGDRVLAHVRPVEPREDGPAERFVVAEVHEGRITRICGYASETDARVDLNAG